MKVIAITAIAIALGASAPAPDQTVVYEGARVWNGAGFSERTLAVRGGRFVDPTRAPRDAVRVSLGGHFVTPAYANAHAHVTGPNDASSRGFTDAGIYYVLNPNTVTMSAAERAFFGRAGRYSVKVAQGGITEPRGHPEPLYVDVLGPGVYPGRPREWFVGNAFHYGETIPQIDAALAELVRQKADVVKIYLLNSERHDAIRNDPAFEGYRGLDPANIRHLVKRAHALRLRVFAHVETANDLKVAAEAGVDVAAHLPAYHTVKPQDLDATRLTPEIAALVARSGMQVTPTYALAKGGDRYSTTTTDAQRAIIEVQSHNLKLLRAAGVKLLIGTDGFNQIFSEVEHLVAANGLSPREVAAALFATGPTLFPERRIGCFQRGCEADFLVLRADPTIDIHALRAIERRVMAGVELASPAPTTGG